MYLIQINTETQTPYNVAQPARQTLPHTMSQTIIIGISAVVCVCLVTIGVGIISIVHLVQQLFITDPAQTISVAKQEFDPLKGATLTCQAQHTANIEQVYAIQLEQMIDQIMECIAGSGKIVTTHTAICDQGQEYQSISTNKLYMCDALI